jgi:large subunit ribosomal protein L18
LLVFHSRSPACQQGRKAAKKQFSPKNRDGTESIIFLDAILVSRIVMKGSLTKQSGRTLRKNRVRARISGNAERPRLSVFRSLTGISVQAIDDMTGKTLFSAYLREIQKGKASNTVVGAREVGKLVAKKCLANNIRSAVFDRSSYRYHGRVKAVAEGAREGGLIL